MIKQWTDEGVYDYYLELTGWEDFAMWAALMYGNNMPEKETNRSKDA